MNEPDIINTRDQLHLAMKEAAERIPELFAAYEKLSGRKYEMAEGYHHTDASELLVLLGSSYETAKEGVDKLRRDGTAAGAVTLNVLRPFPEKELFASCEKAERIMVADRQDSYGAWGGNLSLEVRAMMQKFGGRAKIKSLVYGLGGLDFFAEDAEKMLDILNDPEASDFSYYGVTAGDADKTADRGNFFAPLTRERTGIGATTVQRGTAGEVQVKGGTLNATAAMPKRIAPGHGACPGCGIPVNLNLLLRAIEDPVVLLFQTGCGMIVTTAYPRTSFKVPYLHNLFQNGAATLSGLAEICYRKQKKGEIPPGDIVFVMVSGDGGMDIGMGSAIGTALRGHRILLFEYDTGGYMNTGYQLSYSTPKGARSATSHVGKMQYGKTFFHKDMPRIMAATGIPYIATVAESNPADFIRKAAKAAYYAKTEGTAYVKALSACPLNWNDNPATERRVIEAGVNCCYFPLFEIERGKTTLSFDPDAAGKKIPVTDWLAMMGRTRHLCREEYRPVADSLQQEIDRRYERLKLDAEKCEK